MTNFSALIFDLDDTLVTTAEIWRTAEQALLVKLRVSNYDDAFLAGLNGRSANDVARIIHERFQPDVSLAACREDFRSMLLAAIESVSLEPKSGAVETVRRLSGDRMLAVASGSPLATIESVLRRLDLAGYFQKLVSSDEVGEGKPSPKVFREAARRLGVPPHHCVVIEDSLVGVQAAKAAGMTCVAIPSSPAERQTILKLADLVLDDLTQFRPDWINGFGRKAASP